MGERYVFQDLEAVAWLLEVLDKNIVCLAVCKNTSAEGGVGRSVYMYE